MSIFACAQLTRDAVWLPELLDHPNTARAIRKLSIAAPGPRLLAESWVRALPGSILLSIGSGAQIQVGSHVIDLLDPATAVRRYDLARGIERPTAFAIEFDVMDVNACREVLRRGGLTPKLHGDLTSVGSEDACGVIIGFSPTGAPLA
jgi:hypothetical protein